MEAIQKQGDSIDKLTSLMNELSSKLDRKDNSYPYKPRIHPLRNRGCKQRENRYSSREIEEITKPKTIMVLESIEIGTEITRIIDPIIEGKILTKIMAKGLDIGT